MKKIIRILVGTLLFNACVFIVLYLIDLVSAGQYMYAFKILLISAVVVAVIWLTTYLTTEDI